MRQPSRLLYYSKALKAHHIPAVSITTKATSPFNTAPSNLKSLFSDTGVLRLWWLCMHVINLLATISYFSLAPIRE